MHKKKLSTDRIVQIVLVVVVVVLLVSLLRKENDPYQSDWDIQESEETGMMEGGDTTEPDDVMEATTPSTPSTTPSATTPSAPAQNSAYAGGNCVPSLRGEKSSELNAILLNWTPCANLENFQFYKLVKSSIVENPTYPADPVAFSSSNKNAANFVDKTVARATTYHYRICAVQRINKVTCSNKVSVTY